MHRAAWYGIRRDPGRGYHGEFYVRHGKRWSAPSTVSDAFSFRWHTLDAIRHSYLSVTSVTRWLDAIESPSTNDTPREWKVA